MRQKEHEVDDIFYYVVHDVALADKCHNAEMQLSTKLRTRCLDLGCSARIWLYEMRGRNRHVDVLGIDLLDCQPPRTQSIPNVSFLNPVDLMEQR